MSKKNRLPEAPAKAPETMETLTTESIDALKHTYDVIGRLSAARARNKLSNSRTLSVAKELKELIKVMSQYGC